mgnify:CR=1 FL=1
MIFITELGINYAFGTDKNKFIDNIKEMIDMVSNSCERSGIDKNEVIIKFQKRNVDEAVPEEQKNKEKEVPWRKDKTTYYQYKMDMELSLEQFKDINKYCKLKGLQWTASAWDVDSVIFLSNFKIPFIKIPSAKIINEDLVRECAKNFYNIIISTGMSTEEEIEKCVKWIEEEWKKIEPSEFGTLPNTQLYIMHCNSSYPAKDEELNLNYIIQLKEKYEDRGHVIGYSGHEEGISACIVAATIGANIFERHITLSRSNWGTDQAASIIYDQLWRLLRDLNKIDIWRGDGVKKIYESELPIKKKLRG